MLADENKGKINPADPLDNRFYIGTQCVPMAKKSIPSRVGLRPNPQDYSLISKLRDKLGVDNSQIIRLALRKLAEAEGLKAS